MAYIGNAPADRFTSIPTVQQFNGDGSTTAFTLSRPVGTDQDLLVSVDGVIQDTAAYAVSNGTTLTFSAAPSSGTANIFVNYLGVTIGSVVHPASSSISAAGASLDGAVTINDSSADVDFRVETNGNANMLFVDGGNDAVGIGTSTPGSYYSGAEQLVVAKASGEAGITIATASDTSGALYFADGTSGAQAYQGGIGYQHDTSKLFLVESGVATMFFGPTEYVFNETSLDRDFRVESNGNANMLFVDGGNDKIGIGTSSPSDSGGKLAVKTANAGYAVIEPTSSVTNQIATGIRLHGNANETDRYAGIFCYNGAANNVNSMTFWTTNSGSSAERMRIDSSGNLLVGRTSVGDTGNGHTIRGGDSAVFSRDSSGETMIVARNDSQGDLIQFRRNGSVCGEIVNTGGSTVAYNTSSDYRLKENVVYDWDATTRLKQLKPSRFNFIADGTDRAVDGFLAHEVATVVPEAITGAKDAMMDEEYEVTPAVLDDDGNVTTEAVMGTRSVPKYQGIDQSKLVPLLVKTIQELEARITALEG